MSQRVLITGATGFAGSFLVEHYAQRGWEVVGTGRPDSMEDTSWLPTGVRIVPTELTDPEDVDRLLADFRPDLIQHLAAQSSVSASWHDPLATLGDNAAMQFRLLEAAVRFVPEARVLVVGSCDEYGSVPAEMNPVNEEAPLLPASPYALSKVVQDLMGRQYADRGLQVVRVRPFLQIGPRRSPRFVAGSFALQVAEISLGLRTAVIIAGNVDLQRDFTDVRDVIAAYALAAERGVVGEVYNIASGTAHSLRDMLQCMLAAVGTHAEIRIDPSLVRAGETPLLVGDASRLRDATGWAPTIQFERSVRDTVEYWRQQIEKTRIAERGSA